MMEITLKIDKDAMMRDLDKYLSKQVDEWIIQNIMNYVSSDYKGIKLIENNSVGPDPKEESEVCQLKS